MGAVELYCATDNQDALDLARHIVDLRGSTYKGNENFSAWGRPMWGPIENYQGGRDLYQNFIPLRREKEVVGHAVFFTYLYAGAADVFMETGDKSLLVALERLWADLTEKKMYITGGVSPVHKGPVTRSFIEGERQVCRWEPIHEGITTLYDLPNSSAYNETCGMVGNMMWNWRMLQATGDPRYAEMMELSWYNSILSDVELDGSRWSYTNRLKLKESTDDPWDGKIKLAIQDAPDRALALKLRIPSWTSKASIRINGKALDMMAVPGSHVEVSRVWKPGDVLQFDLNMKTRLLAGHPRSEHIRNQVAVKRGPVVYCLESNDVKGDYDLEQIAIDAQSSFVPEYRADMLGGVTVLKTTARATAKPDRTIVGQYVDITEASSVPADVELIPYYGWNNREEPKMSVWLPLAR